MSGNKILKTAVIIALCSIIIFSCSANKPADLVQKFEAAINSHMVDSIMSFYNENVTVELGGLSSAMTEVELRPLAEWDSAMNTIVHFQIKAESGDTVTCFKSETNDWYRAFGIDTVFSDPVVIIFKEGRIRVLKTELRPESVHAMQDAFQRFYAWAYEEEPRKLKELMPDGVPIYGAASAKKWMELLAKWRQAASM